MLDEHDVVRLGAGGAIQRDGFLGEVPAAALRVAVDDLVASATLEPAGMSRGGQWRRDATERGDLTTWLDRAGAPPAIAHLYARLDGLATALNQGAYMGLRRCDVQLARYPGGGARYARHVDEFSVAAGRRVTAILYLNRDWTESCGGQLRLHLDAGALDVAPIFDRLVVF